MKPNAKNADELLAAITICALLLLMPWPAAMMIASVIALIGWLLMSKGSGRTTGLVVWSVAFAIAAAVGVIISRSQDH